MKMRNHFTHTHTQQTLQLINFIECTVSVLFDKTKIASQQANAKKPNGHSNTYKYI